MHAITRREMLLLLGFTVASCGESPRSTGKPDQPPPVETVTLIIGGMI